VEAGWLAKVFEDTGVEVMIINTSGGEEDRMNGSETNKRLSDIFCCNFLSNSLLEFRKFDFARDGTVKVN